MERSKRVSEDRMKLEVLHSAINAQQVYIRCAEGGRVRRPRRPLGIHRWLDRGSDAEGRGELRDSQKRERSEVMAERGRNAEGRQTRGVGGDF